MKRLSFITTVGLAVAVWSFPSVCAAAKTFQTHTLKSLAFTVPRGGAGPLDPIAVAKASVTGVLVAQTLCVLGPERALQIYGAKQPTPENVMVARRGWSFFLGNALTSYLLHVHDASINAAVGYGTFPVIADVLRSVLNDDEKKLGIPSISQLVVVLLPLVANAYVCLNNMKIANTVTKVCGVYNVLKGVWYILDTENTGRFWGLRSEPDKYTILLAKWMGVSLVLYGMWLIGVNQGVNIVKLTGYGWIPVMLNFARDVYMQSDDINLSVYYMWMVLGMIVIGTLAID
jgi:hypothetical protein